MSKKIFIIEIIRELILIPNLINIKSKLNFEKL